MSHNRYDTSGIVDPPKYRTGTATTFLPGRVWSISIVHVGPALCLVPTLFPTLWELKVDKGSRATLRHACSVAALCIHCYHRPQSVSFRSIIRFVKFKTTITYHRAKLCITPLEYTTPGDMFLGAHTRSYVVRAPNVITGV